MQMENPACATPEFREESEHLALAYCNSYLFLQSKTSDYLVD